MNSKNLLLLLFLLLLVIISGLITTDYFYQGFSTAYYGFCISALLFVLIIFFQYSKIDKCLLITKPVIFFGLLVLYVIISYFFYTGSLMVVLYYSTHFLFICSAIQLFRSPSFNFNYLGIGIVGIASLEALYCIIQYIGWFNTTNELFIVTGTWSNPNITGLFLAMTAPFFFNLFSKKHKLLSFTIFGVLVIALWLLQCRAAFIGTVISAIVFFGLEYNFIHWARVKKNRLAFKSLVIVVVVCLVPIFNNLYNSKQGSSDGRVFIWKLSSLMIKEKPLFGYGYGLFEKEYNEFQSKYIEKGKANAEEMQNAGTVLVPHNEILQSGVEGGLLGILLFFLFIGSLLFSINKIQRLSKENENHIETLELLQKYTYLDLHQKRLFNLAYAGVIGFAVMSMVNFATQCIPAMIIFSLYTAIICSRLKAIVLPEWVVKKKYFICLIIKTLGIVLSVFLLYCVTNTAIADRQNKKALVLREAGNYDQALSLLRSLKPTLKHNSDYWKNMGLVYLNYANYADAIVCFNLALEKSASADLFLAKGICYEKLNQEENSIQQFRLLVLSKPSKFQYRFILMQAYLKNKDLPNAKSTAQGIVDLNPKIPSPKVEYYKKMAQNVINNDSLLQTNK